MVSIDARAGEPLRTYLCRAIDIAQRTSTNVCVSWGGATAIVTPRSTVAALVLELEAPR